MKSSELEPHAEKALHFLHRQAGEHAQARANASYMDSWVKLELQRIKGLMVGDMSDAAKNAEAMRHPAYEKALQAQKEADEAWFTAQFKREAAMALIEAWRTCCSNERANV